MNVHQLRDMLKAISLTRDRELTCAEVDAELLARYVELELAGERPGTRLSDLHRHLALCPDCRREYREVREMLRRERTGEWVEPTTEPTFDLSFLESPEQEPESRPWTQVSARVRRYVARIPALRLPQLAQAGQLPPGLRLSYAPGVPSRMRGPQAEAASVSFQLADPTAHLRIQVEVDRVGEDAVWITVRPAIREGEPFPPGASVGLLDEEGRPLEIRALGPENRVRFKEVRIGRTYILRVGRGEESWEIPVELETK
jgi:hypothetical protein